MEIVEMWYKDVKENFKEINEQAEYENLLIIARIYPIETYEIGKKHIKKYIKYLQKYFPNISKEKGPF